jgi:hypothetical protein
MRPAPQGRAYRERRHFCHVTILLSSDDKDAAKTNGKSGEVKPATSKRAKRGGAAAAPRMKGTAKPEAESASSEGSEASEKKASSKTSGAKKAASKLGSALKRKKKEKEEE